MKKLLSLLLAILMLGAVLVSCADSSDPNAPDATTTGSGGEVTTAGAVTTPDPMQEYHDKVPTGSYGNAKFSIWNQTSTWALTTMQADPDGDSVNEAVYKRNVNVETKLSIELDILDVSSGLKANVQNGFASNDVPDVIWGSPGDTMSLSVGGYIQDATEIEEMNLESPWWYPETNASINFGDTRYLLFSDIHLHFHESFYTVAFNKVLLDKYPELTSPYELVASNAWTMTKMNEMMTVVADDTNGDGKMTEDEDLFGLCAHKNQGPNMMVALGAFILTEKDGILQFDGLSERFLSAYDVVLMTTYNDDLTCGGNYDPVFTNGRSLFMTETTGALKEHREDEYEYGLVVLPKYNRKQESYYSPIAYSAGTLGIIKSADESKLSRIGVVLENMAAESNKILKPSYYQILVHLKYAKDETSIAMLDIIYSVGHFECNNPYNFGGSRARLENAFRAHTNNISSLIDPLKNVINEDINKYYVALGLKTE